MVALQDLKRQQKRKCRIILHFRRRADPMRIHYEEIDRKIASIRKQAERPPQRQIRRLKLTHRAKGVTWKPVTW